MYRCMHICNIYLYSACTMKHVHVNNTTYVHVHVINRRCVYNIFCRLLQISSFSGKMNALNEVYVHVHVIVCVCVCTCICTCVCVCTCILYVLMCLCLLQISKIIPTSITYHPHFRTAADEEQLTVERIGV